jgi:methylthioribose-1-phosphate isomerase
MNVNGKWMRTIWPLGEIHKGVAVIDQRRLPHRFEILQLTTVQEIAWAISDMVIRGAGLIGATAAYGMAIAARDARDNSFAADCQSAADTLIKTRPTASNLAWAVRRQLKCLEGSSSLVTKRQQFWDMAATIANEDAQACQNIGQHGLNIIKKIAEQKKGQTIRVLTHCNAGWLAFVDYGSATAPIYAAHDAGIAIEVWVDETRPRNQGASLTAWELGQHGVKHHLIADNTGGHLMQHGMVDLVIVGADRVTANGDVANKIGTYLKALAAKDNGIPFYVALPSSTFDTSVADGLKEIPIEERSPEEVRTMEGEAEDGSIQKIRICPPSTPALNYGFDVTPARLITGLITERGLCEANSQGIHKLFPDLIFHAK